MPENIKTNLGGFILKTITSFQERFEFGCYLKPLTKWLINVLLEAVKEKEPLLGGVCCLKK